MQFEYGRNIQNNPENIEFIAGILVFQKKVIANILLTRYRWFVPNRRV